jgi:hypothetical protein
MLTRCCWPLRSITTELPLAERRRQPVEPIASPTDALVELPPIWKMAEPLWPGTCTTPTSSGEPPSVPGAGPPPFADEPEPLAPPGAGMAGAGGAPLVIVPLTGTRKGCAAEARELDSSGPRS